MVSNDGIIGNGTTDLWRRLRKLLERWPTEDFKKGITDMNLGKHKDDTLYAIRHNMRMLPQGRKHSNEEIDPERSKLNESIVKRGDTPEKVNEYRKQIESELFHYNRKDLVHSIEMVITLPEDCPPEQEHDFWVSSYEYVASTLPMGERAIFLCEIHRDEGRVQKDGVTVVESPAHMHIMFVPAVPDQKHEGFKYKLCADQLTKRSTLQQWHPRYQKWLDNAGIKATVHSGVTGGKSVSVSALKDLTKATGLTLAEVKELVKDKEKLTEILQNVARKISAFEEILNAKDNALSQLKNTITDKDKIIADMSLSVESKDTEMAALKAELRNQSETAEQLKTAIDMKDREYSELRARADNIISDKKQEIEDLKDSDINEANRLAKDKQRAYDQLRAKASKILSDKNHEIDSLKSNISKTAAKVSDVMIQLKDKELAYEELNAKANQIIRSDREQISNLRDALTDTEQKLADTMKHDKEMVEKAKMLEEQLKVSHEKDLSWGSSSNWGHKDRWHKEQEVKRTW